MNLKMSELERARQHPKKFAASRLRKFGGIRPSFSMYWILAAKHFHKLKAGFDPKARKKALDYFSAHCNAKLSGKDFNSKLSKLSGRLDEYIADYEKLNYALVQVNKRVQFFDVPGHSVSGRVDRLDIDPAGGYFATSFEANESDWESRLKVPIIQKALANELGCPTNEIRVGVFCIESEDHQYVTMTAQQISAAVKELGALLSEVEREIRLLDEKK